jgi:VanZ family protein
MAIAFHWGPVVLWMAVIFFFSTDYFSSSNTEPVFGPLLARLFPNASPTRIEEIIALVRKLGHWGEYLILAVLLMRALSAEYLTQPPLCRVIWSIILASLYAVSDELHQSFVPTRTASPVDVVIDSFGAICGTVGSHLRIRRKNRA